MPSSTPVNAAALLQQIAAMPITGQPVPLTPEQFAEERAAWTPPPQPQHFVLQLPADLSNCWDDWDILKQYQADGGLVVNTSPSPIPWPNRPGFMINPGEPIPGQAWPGDPGIRAVLVFDSTNVLLIVADQGKGGSHVGEPLNTRFSYRERNLARKNEAPRWGSDVAYLFRAIFAKELEAKTIPPCDIMLGANKQLIETLVNFGRGRKFEADWEWSAKCQPARTSRKLENSQRVDRIDPANGQPIPGCGHAVYQRDWPRDPQTGLLREQIGCPGVFPAGTLYAGQPCGALLEPFGNLRRFQPHLG